MSSSEKSSSSVFPELCGCTNPWLSFRSTSMVVEASVAQRLGVNASAVPEGSHSRLVDSANCASSSLLGFRLSSDALALSRRFRKKISDPSAVGSSSPANPWITRALYREDQAREAAALRPIR
eukprot:GEMP01075664.1.p1 GENE.GEMP01075664.1~~GEMP01075664.1.p1  ORF type:complete len:123 (-),score=12.84 GEMP01075664.1:124-492(-)